MGGLRNGRGAGRRFGHDSRLQSAIQWLLLHGAGFVVRSAVEASKHDGYAHSDVVLFQDRQSAESDVPRKSFDADFETALQQHIAPNRMQSEFDRIIVLFMWIHCNELKIDHKVLAAVELSRATWHQHEPWLNPPFGLLSERFLLFAIQ